MRFGDIHTYTLTHTYDLEKIYQMNSEARDWSAKTCVAELPRVHDEQRRRERNLGERDFTTAIKLGDKEVHKNKRGVVRIKYTYKDVVYITNETSTREVMSYDIEMPLPKVEIPARHELQIQEAKKRPNIVAHIILVVDQSGSMNCRDAHGHRSRSRAVYYTIANEIIAASLLQLPICHSMAVTLIEMREESLINPDVNMEPISWMLYNKFVSLAEEPLSAKSHGYYQPAMNLVNDIIFKSKEGVSLMFFILSDGRPSDGMDYKHRLTPIFHYFRNRLTFGAFGFGCTKDNFEILKYLHVLAVSCGVKSFFQKGLDSKALRQNLTLLMTSLSTIMTSLSSLRATNNKKETREGLVHDFSLNNIDPQLSLMYSNEWDTYFSQTDKVSRMKHTRDDDQFLELTPARWSHGSACGIAIRKTYFGIGAERAVHEMTEVDGGGMPVGEVMCAKIDKYNKEGISPLKFHKRFGESMNKASKDAKKFNEWLDFFMVDKTVPRIKFLKCWYYSYDVFKDNKKLKDSVLCEPKLDENKFFKWNDNKGGLGNVPAAQLSESNVHQCNKTAFNDAITEKQLHAKILDEDVPQAFSHFTFRCSNEKYLVVDLQGVLSQDVSSPVFKFTDPAIHSYIGRFGETDLKKAGMESFFETHRCNPLCKILRLESPLKTRLFDDEWDTYFAHTHNLRKSKLGREWRSEFIAVRGISVKKTYFDQIPQRIVHEVDNDGVQVGVNMFATIDPPDAMLCGKTQRYCSEYAQEFNRHLCRFGVDYSIEFAEVFMYTYNPQDGRNKKEVRLSCVKKRSSFRWNDYRGGVWSVPVKQLKNTTREDKLQEIGEEEQKDHQIKRDDEHDSTHTAKQSQQNMLDNDIPQAFSHFTYEHSKRRYLVVNLQGVITRKKWLPHMFEFINPTVHFSRSEGLKLFFQSHRCNSICRMLQFRESLLVNKKWATYFADTHSLKIYKLKHSNNSKFLDHSAWGIGIKKDPFGRSANREIYEMTEVNKVGIPVGEEMLCSDMIPHDVPHVREIQEQAHCLAIQFNERLRDIKVNHRIEFLQFFVYTCNTQERGEYEVCKCVLGKKKLSGKWIKWSDDKGGICNAPKQQDNTNPEDKQPEIECVVNNLSNTKNPIQNVTQAFTHYTYEKSNKSCLVVHIQGVISKYRVLSVLKCTNPVIHSEQQLYGPRDLGGNGISSFFDTHSCNNFCERLGLIPHLSGPHQSSPEL